MTQCRRLHPALVALALAFAPLAATAQTGPCGVGNVRNWCVHEDSPGVTGVAQANDLFGAALAFGDFDGDGAVDLAVGAPGEADGAANNAGAVWVFYGSGAGLHAAGEQVFDQDSFPGDHGGTETGDQFGYALAAGDLDADGFDDLAIGTPFENSPEPLGTCGFDLSCDDHGVFHVVFGSAGGLDFDRTYSTGSSFSQGDGKGFALAVGDFDGDPSDGAELAVASPGSFDSSLGGADHTGRVALYRFDAVNVMAPLGSFTSDPQEQDAQWGWAIGGGKLGTDGSPGIAVGAHHSDVAGSNQAGRATLVDPAEVEPHDDLVQTDFGTAGNGGDDHFGAALAVGDFDGDGRDDLAIGTPEKDDSSTDDSGRVYVAFGSAAGLDPADFQIFRIASFPGSPPAANDRFGAALAAGDYDGDGRDDLFIGSPGRGNDDRGFIYFLHGGSGGLTVGAGFNFSEPILQGTAQEDARFGSVLAMGDLDGDGTDELAIGVPDRDIDGSNDAGLVYVTRFFDPHWIFGDGFESAAVGLWSSHLP